MCICQCDPQTYSYILAKAQLIIGLNKPKIADSAVCCDSMVRTAVVSVYTKGTGGGGGVRLGGWVGVYL